MINLHLNWSIITIPLAVRKTNRYGTRCFLFKRGGGGGGICNDLFSYFLRGFSYKNLLIHLVFLIFLIV